MFVGRHYVHKNWMLVCIYVMAVNVVGFYHLIAYLQQTFGKYCSACDGILIVIVETDLLLINCAAAVVN